MLDEADAPRLRRMLNWFESWGGGRPPQDPAQFREKQRRGRFIDRAKTLVDHPKDETHDIQLYTVFDAGLPETYGEPVPCYNAIKEIKAGNWIYVAMVDGHYEIISGDPCADAVVES